MIDWLLRRKKIELVKKHIKEDIGCRIFSLGDYEVISKTYPGASHISYYEVYRKESLCESFTNIHEAFRWVHKNHDHDRFIAEHKRLDELVKDILGDKEVEKFSYKGREYRQLGNYTFCNARYRIENLHNGQMFEVCQLVDAGDNTPHYQFIEFYNNLDDALDYVIEKTRGMIDEQPKIVIDKDEPIAWVYNTEQRFFYKGYYITKTTDIYRSDVRAIAGYEFGFTEGHPYNAENPILFEGTLDQCFKYAEQYIMNKRNK